MVWVATLLGGPATYPLALCGVTLFSCSSCSCFSWRLLEELAGDVGDTGDADSLSDPDEAERRSDAGDSESRSASLSWAGAEHSCDADVVRAGGVGGTLESGGGAALLAGFNGGGGGDTGGDLTPDLVPVKDALRVAGALPGAPLGVRDASLPGRGTDSDLLRLTRTCNHNNL